MPRSLEEIIARQNELADAFEQAEPTGKAVTREEILARRKLRAAAHEMSSAHRTLAEAVSAARTQHLSWKSIGKELGTSGEAARQRFARLVANGGTTGS